MVGGCNRGAAGVAKDEFVEHGKKLDGLGVVDHGLGVEPVLDAARRASASVRFDHQAKSRTVAGPWLWK
jgi:hypothetical protein